LSCGIAIGKAIDPHGAPDTTDIELALDLTGLLHLGAGAAKLVKYGPRVYKAAGQVGRLATVRKGRLVKTISQMEKAGHDLSYVRELLDQGARSSRTGLRSPTTNNQIKHALKYATARISTEKLDHMITGITAALGTGGSFNGGTLGIALKIKEIRVTQEKITER